MPAQLVSLRPRYALPGCQRQCGDRAADQQGIFSEHFRPGSCRHNCTLHDALHDALLSAFRFLKRFLSEFTSVSLQGSRVECLQLRRGTFELCAGFIRSEVLLWGKVTKYLRHLPLVKERI